MKAATHLKIAFLRERGISIHAAREGGDECAVAVEIRFGISIHAAREGGDSCGVNGADSCGISIHAAREGGDLLLLLLLPFEISIHAAREGGDLRRDE